MFPLYDYGCVVRSMASVGALLDEITFEIPLKEALQYTKGKEKWTRADIKVNNRRKTRRVGMFS